jgi:hypothetical protein
MTFLSVIGGIVVLLWLLGLIFSIGGMLIHILLAVGIIMFLIDLFMGKAKKK